jgi:hypothetical protein
MRLGVDLGTTWTGAAIHGDGAVKRSSWHTIATPSVVAVVDGQIVAGNGAERRLATDPAAGARERRLRDSSPYLLDGTPYGAEALRRKPASLEAAEPVGEFEHAIAAADDVEGSVDEMFGDLG